MDADGKRTGIKFGKQEVFRLTDLKAANGECEFVAGTSVVCSRFARSVSRIKLSTLVEMGEGGGRERGGVINTQARKICKRWGMMPLVQSRRRWQSGRRKERWRRSCRTRCLRRLLSAEVRTEAWFKSWKCECAARGARGDVTDHGGVGYVGEHAVAYSAHLQQQSLKAR